MELKIVLPSGWDTLQLLLTYTFFFLISEPSCASHCSEKSFQYPNTCRWERCCSRSKQSVGQNETLLPGIMCLHNLLLIYYNQSCSLICLLSSAGCRQIHSLFSASLCRFLMLLIQMWNYSCSKNDFAVNHQSEYHFQCRFKINLKQHLQKDEQRSLFELIHLGRWNLKTMATSFRGMSWCLLKMVLYLQE